MARHCEYDYIIVGAGSAGCKQPITLNAKLSPLNKLLIGMRWILLKTGLGATNHFESCAFIRSNNKVRWPDIQYHFLPAAMRYDGNAAFDDYRNGEIQPSEHIQTDDDGR